MLCSFLQCSSNDTVLLSKAALSRPGGRGGEGMGDVEWNDLDGVNEWSELADWGEFG